MFAVTAPGLCEGDPNSTPVEGSKPESEPKSESEPKPELDLEPKMDPDLSTPETEAIERVADLQLSIPNQDEIDTFQKFVDDVKKQCDVIEEQLRKKNLHIG